MQERFLDRARRGVQIDQSASLPERLDALWEVWVGAFPTVLACPGWMRAPIHHGAVTEWSENSVPVHGDLSHQRSREESTRKESIYERMPIVQCAHDAAVRFAADYSSDDHPLASRSTHGVRALPIYSKIHSLSKG